MTADATTRDTETLSFYGGSAGALLPFALFLSGVAWLGLSGAPDERGLWPVLLAAVALSVLLARDRERAVRTLLDSMSRRIVLLMVMAWMLAGVLGSLLSAAGLVDGLVWLARTTGLSGGGYVAAAFLVCAVFSTSTGTSLGTLILCVPLLYPVGGALGASPVWLAGALLGGATFGDNISPASDTTIASASSQGADVGGVVRTRLRYALPAAAMALLGALMFGGSTGSAAAAGSAVAGAPSAADPGSLLLLLAPALVLGLLLRGSHLLIGLLSGVAAAAALGLLGGRLLPSQLLFVEPGAFSAQGLLLDGMERGLGISVFTILLMGLVGTIEASGLLERLVDRAARSVDSARGAELWIFATVSAAVLLTTHSVVAILAVGSFAARTGERFGLSPYRRANLLDATVCTYPFLLPWFIPTILLSSLTADAGIMPRLSALQAGIANLHSWGLLAVMLLAVATGYGRGRDRDR